MFKVRLALPALLSTTLIIFAASSSPARAQVSDDAKMQPVVAVTAQAATSNDSADEPAAPAAPQQKKTQQPQPGATPAGTGQRNSHRPAPLTGGQKIERSFRSAFLRPAPYLLSALTAGITQLREDRLPHKDNADEVADWGSRAARSFATRSTTTLFASGFYPALLRQDPRYEPSQSKNFGRRALHAVSRVFVTRDDDWNVEPNYSRFAGVMTASALANVWEHSTPGHDRIGPDATLRRFARSFITGSISNIVFKEFGADIIGIFRH
ncbi:MAG: hypothetical protein QOJ76_922 [Acidobacteriota bacterium]|jgi:hypothetical protein|nr:hypothetical protein [Acidobacteriota bacterium]